MFSEPQRQHSVGNLKMTDDYTTKTIARAGLKLSVLVCTHNRSYNVIPCLDSIVQSLSNAAPIEAEIVVIDNASKDNTAIVLKEWAAKSPFPVNLQFEAKKGASYAQIAACVPHVASCSSGPTMIQARAGLRRNGAKIRRRRCRTRLPWRTRRAWRPVRLSDFHNVGE